MHTIKDIYFLTLQNIRENACESLSNRNNLFNHYAIAFLVARICNIFNGIG